MSPRRIRTVLEMIKFEHSIFALPFALTGAMLAARYAGNQPGWPTPRQILWIVVAMVGARSAAMTMNRIADVHYDRANPRTASRALPTGALSLSFAWAFTLVSAAVLVASSLATQSSRVRALPRGASHPVRLLLHQAFHPCGPIQCLASARGISPAAAWIAVGRLARRAHANPLRRRHALGLAASSVLYACQDVEARPLQESASTRSPSISASAAPCGSRA